jgi:transposase
VDEGLTIAAIAARFGAAAQTVHNWLVAAGVPRRPSPTAIRDDIRDDEIVRLYTDAGRAAAAIAREIGCSVSSVYDRLARHGVARRSPSAGSRVRPPNSELAGLYRDGGLSLRALAGRYEVSAQAMHRWLVAAGINRRPSSPPAGRGEDPIVLYRAGLSAPAIAEQLGCSPSTVYRRLDAVGVARRSVTPRIRRQQLIDALDAGMSAPAIAATYGVSVSCVCRALAREQLMTNRQAARQRRRLRYPELYLDTAATGANVNVSGNA